MSNFISFFLCGLFFILFGCDRTISNSSLNQQPDEESATLPVTINPEQKADIILQVEQQREDLNLCNQEKDQALSNNSTQVYSLNQSKYLVEILCFLGAYQGNYQYLWGSQNDKKLNKINFPIFRRDESGLKLSNTFTLVGGTEFDDINQILMVKTKARGLGDCGSYIEYKWQNSQFTLKEYRDKSECDGVYLEPQNYPLIYP